MIFLPYSLDTVRYNHGLDDTKQDAEEWINQNYVLSIHPEWLFKKGRKNRRGPFYDVLKSILEVDKELETLRIRKKAFFKIAHDIKEYEKNIIPTDEFIEKLRRKRCRCFYFS